MRSFKWAVAALALSGLTGCFGNSDPELYRVALAASPNPLPTSCYRGGVAPPTTPGEDQTNTVTEGRWTLWDGIDDVKYLDFGGGISAGMANAPNINIQADAIEGSKNDDGNYVFTVENTERQQDATIITAATFTFEELGQTAEGTLTLRSSCAGTGCGTNNQLTCEYSRRFVGRRIDGDREIDVGSTN